MSSPLVNYFSIIVVPHTSAIPNSLSSAVKSLASSQVSSANGLAKEKMTLVGVGTKTVIIEVHSSMTVDVCRCNVLLVNAVDVRSFEALTNHRVWKDTDVVCRVVVKVGVAHNVTGSRVEV